MDIYFHVLLYLFWPVLWLGFVGVEREREREGEYINWLHACLGFVGYKPLLFSKSNLVNPKEILVYCTALWKEEGVEYSHNDERVDLDSCLLTRKTCHVVLHKLVIQVWRRRNTTCRSSCITCARRWAPARRFVHAIKATVCCGSMNPPYASPTS